QIGSSPAPVAVAWSKGRPQQRHCGGPRKASPAQQEEQSAPGAAISAPQPRQRSGSRASSTTAPARLSQGPTARDPSDTSLGPAPAMLPPDHPGQHHSTAGETRRQARLSPPSSITTSPVT